MQVATKSFSVNRWKSFAVVSFLSSFTPSFSPESSLTHIHYCSQARINDIAGRLCVSCAPFVLVHQPHSCSVLHTRLTEIVLKPSTCSDKSNDHQAQNLVGWPSLHKLSHPLEVGPLLDITCCFIETECELIILGLSLWHTFQLAPDSET